MTNFKLSAQDLALLSAEDEQDRLLEYALSLCRKHGLGPDAAKDLLREAVSDLIVARNRGDRDDVLAIAFLRRGMRSRAIDLRRARQTVRKHADSAKLLELFVCDPGRIDENDAELKGIASAVFTWLRAKAEENDDIAVVFLLDAYAKPELDTAREYRTDAGLDVSEYEAARKRLDTLISHLPRALTLASLEQLGEVQ